MEVENEATTTNTFQSHLGVKKISSDGQSFTVVEKERYEQISFDDLKKFLSPEMYKSIRSIPTQIINEDYTISEYDLRMAYHNSIIDDTKPDWLVNDDCDEDNKRKRNT